MLISSSSAMKNVINLAEKAAKYPVNVLILGETGCGKELVARHIHETSGCKGKFMSINCTALPKELLESELFGHSKGAFTGAYKSKKGIMEESDGGSLLLDEIGDMPIGLQPKLLRVLETNTYTPLGLTVCKTFDTRIISTTNKNLSKQTTFRSDLYFRLTTIIIDIPPLKERPDDIVTLTNYFLGKIQEDFKLETFPTIDDDRIYTLLLNYPWPGNVRELQNILKRAIIYGDGYLKYDILLNIIENTSGFFKTKQTNTFIWKKSDPIDFKTADRAIETFIIKNIIRDEPGITNIDLASKTGISYITLISRFKEIVPLGIRKLKLKVLNVNH